MPARWRKTATFFDIEAIEKLYEELESNGLGSSTLLVDVSDAVPMMTGESGGDDFVVVTADSITADDPVRSIKGWGVCRCCSARRGEEVSLALKIPGRRSRR